MPTITITTRHIAIAAATGLVLAAAFGGGARAVTDTVFQYSAPKTGYLTIHHMAMGPVSSDTPFYHSWGEALTTGSSGCFNTGINLPQGAKITGLATWYAQTLGNDVQLFLYRQTTSTATANDVIAETHLADVSGNRKGTTISITPNSTIDNTKYAYGLGLCLAHAGARFYTARVNYTYTNAGD